MILLKKKQSNGTYFEFDKILIKGYNIDEQQDKKIQKFVNGNRKQIISDYTDVIIQIDIDPFEIEEVKEYVKQLTNGTYQYYSVNDGIMKECKMIVDRPGLNVLSAVGNNIYVDSFKVKLYRAGD